jgi:hypothetical protein
MLNHYFVSLYEQLVMEKFMNYTTAGKLFL